MADGGIRVTKPISGEPHLIRDIQVSVPHRVSVYIPADKVINSKDLHRDLATGAIFQLSGFIRQDAPEGVEDEEVTPLPKPRAAPAVQASDTGLQEGMNRLERQIEALTRTIQTLTMATPVQAAGTVAKMVVIEESPIELDAPMFIPEDLGIKADVNIQVREDVSNTGIDNAASKLKALRKSKS